MLSDVKFEKPEKLEGYRGRITKTRSLILKLNKVDITISYSWQQTQLLCYQHNTDLIMF